MNSFDHLPVGGCEIFLSVNPVDELGHFLIVTALFDKGFQIVVAGGVEQAEAGKVAFGP